MNLIVPDCPGEYLVKVFEGGSFMVKAINGKQTASIEKHQEVTEAPTLKTIWITTGRLNYDFFIDECKRLGYVSKPDGERWTGRAIEARGLFEYLKEMHLMPKNNIVDFFEIFKNTFKSSFQTARSLQAHANEFVIDQKETFSNIFENARKTNEERKENESGTLQFTNTFT